MSAGTGTTITEVAAEAAIDLTGANRAPAEQVAALPEASVSIEQAHAAEKQPRKYQKRRGAKAVVNGESAGAGCKRRREHSLGGGRTDGAAVRGAQPSLQVLKERTKKERIQKTRTRNMKERKGLSCKQSQIQPARLASACMGRGVACARNVAAVASACMNVRRSSAWNAAAAASASMAYAAAMQMLDLFQGWHMLAPQAAI